MILFAQVGRIYEQVVWINFDFFALRAKIFIFAIVGNVPTKNIENFDEECYAITRSNTVDFQ